MLLVVIILLLSFVFIPLSVYYNTTQIRNILMVIDIISIAYYLNIPNKKSEYSLELIRQKAEDILKS